MTSRSLLLVALTLALLSPAMPVGAQDGAVATAGPEASAQTADPGLDELAALFPAALAGVPLSEYLQLYPGEQLFSVMSEQEAALLEAFLESNSRSTADYAAANAILPLADSGVVVIQAHRLTGIPAEAARETWLRILSLGLGQPVVTTVSVAGRPMTLVTDTASPEVPALHLFAEGDVTWMVVASDEALVEAFARSVHPGASVAGG